ncbi:SDR family oxidoreductase [Roseomonas sp. 18066]|uniref:SDR family oxidoreductase n=1 Tax=Roseomonas sp. 18066 TaxID=2681412 RepID=UPI00135BEF1E|nr:SDR family oxidoreductase [Roseomonas sp. 18066]
MKQQPLTILVVGATGSIGRQVVDQALRDGHHVRALVRSPRKASFPPGVEIAEGDLTRPESLAAIVASVDAIIFTHGSSGGLRGTAEAVDYGGVLHVLEALGGRSVRVALMTTIGVTDRKGAHDWKRRGERLLRASGLPYTIVRPGWFDYNETGQQRLLMLQGDRRQSGTPADGAVSRRQLAQVLVQALSSAEAVGKTFELITEHGPPQPDLDAVFASTTADRPGALDGVSDAANMPLDREPATIRTALSSFSRLAQGTTAG